ncbi:hypothetical protein NHX12_012925 [Muraenolepis orangiensis]|uniref:Ninjurin-1 n=1 Tax=Muraenolepis orangiensis TaxID=630683 RepID=A0A9Q0I6D4_9TELE|nr:hypothetical protein NHX12_012925 [Muraenolepis orangiensis]
MAKNDKLHRAEEMALNKLEEDDESGVEDPEKGPRPLNLNHYATKKSAAQSMLDVALLMANSSQLKTLLYVGPRYRFYMPMLALLSLSIMLQVAVGLLLVFIGKSPSFPSPIAFARCVLLHHPRTLKYDLNDTRKHAKLNRMNNCATIFVFFTVLINIFITALGFQGETMR